MFGSLCCTQFRYFWLWRSYIHSKSASFWAFIRGTLWHFVAFLASFGDRGANQQFCYDDPVASILLITDASLDEILLESPIGTTQELIFFAFQAFRIDVWTRRRVRCFHLRNNQEYHCTFRVGLGTLSISEPNIGDVRAWDNVGLGTGLIGITGLIVEQIPFFFWSAVGSRSHSSGVDLVCLCQSLCLLDSRDWGSVPFWQVWRLDMILDSCSTTSCFASCLMLP